MSKIKTPDMCGNCGLPATVVCADCGGEFMCPQCNKDLHNRGKRSSHQRQELPTRSPLGAADQESKKAPAKTAACPRKTSSDTDKTDHANTSDSKPGDAAGDDKPSDASSDKAQTNNEGPAKAKSKPKARTSNPDKTRKKFNNSKSGTTHKDAGYKFAMPQLVEDFSEACNAGSSLFDTVAAFFEKLKIDDPSIQEASASMRTAADDATSLRAHFPVYGLMNAGKSTFLSFLLGESVLPARGLAMTTIPIKMGHRPGATATSLLIPNADKWNEVVGVLDSEFKQRGFGGIHQDYLEATARSLGTLSFSSSPVEGIDQIKETLTVLSDVVRLFIQIGQKLEDFIEINLDTLPMVTLDIWIFSDLPVQEFYFVDTPGPNELAMHDVLKQISREVMEDATGCIFVAHPDNVDSDDSGSVYEIVARNYRSSNNRILGILNKVDSLPDAGEIPEIIGRMHVHLGSEDETKENGIKMDVIPTSAFCIHMLVQLNDYIKTGAPISEFPSWDKVTATFKGVSETITPEEMQAHVDTYLEVYKSEEIIKTIRRLYFHAERSSFRKVLLKSEEQMKTLRDVVEKLEQHSLKNADEQRKQEETLRGRITDLESARSMMAEVPRQISEKLQELLQQLLDNLEEEIASIRWGIKDENDQPVDVVRRHTRMALINWANSEATAKIDTVYDNKFAHHLSSKHDEAQTMVSTRWDELILPMTSFEDAGIQALVATSSAPTMDLKNLKIKFKFDYADMGDFEEQGDFFILRASVFQEAIVASVKRKAGPPMEEIREEFSHEISLIEDQFRERLEEAIKRTTEEMDRNHQLESSHSDVTKEEMEDMVRNISRGVSDIEETFYKLTRKLDRRL